MSYNVFRKYTSILNIILLSLTVIATNAAHASLDIGSAVNKSGQQRMLSQRIIKAYFMVAADVNVSEARKQLDSSVGMFEQNLSMLMEFAPNKEIKEALLAVEEQWSVFRMTALSPVDKKYALTFMSEGESLLGKCQVVVDKITEYSGSQSAKIVAISGRQRMLSQRIAKYYTAYYYGLRDRAIVDGFNKAWQDYDAAMTLLNGYAGNTQEVKQKLNKINAQWVFAKKGFENFPNDSDLKPFIINVTMESILGKMDELTRNYASLVDKVASSR